MRALVLVVITGGGILWLQSSPVYYFVWGDSFAELPQHVRMTVGQTETECGSLVRDFGRIVPQSGVYCEQVPRWQDWANALRNLGQQMSDYKASK